jgi:hypothetical protein
MQHDLPCAEETYLPPPAATPQILILLVALQGYGIAPEDSIPLGSLPALTELHMSDMLEGDPGLDHFVYSRFHAQDSLRNLQVSDQYSSITCKPLSYFEPSVA